MPFPIISNLLQPCRPNMTVYHEMQSVKTSARIFSHAYSRCVNLAFTDEVWPFWQILGRLEKRALYDQVLKWESFSEMFRPSLKDVQCTDFPEFWGLPLPRSLIATTLSTLFEFRELSKEGS